MRVLRAITTFKLDVTTSAGTLQIPQVISSVTLGGRESKVIVTNYAFGSSRLLYSTASVFFAGSIGGRDILFLHGNSTQEHETALTLQGIPNELIPQSGLISKTNTSPNTTIVSFLSGIEGLVTVWDSDTQLVCFLSI